LGSKLEELTDVFSLAVIHLKAAVLWV